MDCDTPLSDENLSLALDGLAHDKTQQHLAHCQDCAARLAEFRRLDTVLQQRLRRFECPSPQRLADYHAGMLDASDATAVHEHVQRCPRCQNELEMLVEFLNLPPEEPVADNIIPLRTPPYVWKASRVQIAGNLALKGAEDETTHDARAGSASVFLESKAIPKGFLLTGQVLDSQVNWAGAIAEAWQEGASQQVCILDDSGEFRFELTTSAPITLYITAASGATLMVENIAIQT
jgi:hypothetical protein